MYLVAATLPSMRVILQQLRVLVKSSLASIFRAKTEGSSCPEHPDSSDVSPCRCHEKQLNVKLTGIGALDTLKREGNAIGA